MKFDLVKRLIPQKLLFIALLVMMATGLSVTASYAACVPKPGCSCDVWQAQSNKADANRVRDKAYHRQIEKQPDNGPGMTCYDHALALSSRLGQIFSDTYAGSAFAAANTDVFGAIYDASSGVGNNTATSKSKALGSQYGFVLDKQLQSYASQYTDSLSSFLGATIMSYLGGFMAGLNTIGAMINGVVSSIDAAFTQIQTWTDLLQNILDLVGGALPAAIPAFVAMVKSYWTMIKTYVTGFIAGLQSQIMTFVNNITSMVMGALGSLLGAFNIPGTGECSRIQQLWNPSTGGGPIGSIGTLLAAAGAVTGFRPVTGGGIEHGTPYFDFKALVNKTVAAGGVDLMKEINNATNSPVLSAALADISAGGILNTFKAPGAGVTWTQPENLPLNSTVTFIISKM